MNDQGDVSGRTLRQRLRLVLVLWALTLVLGLVAGRVVSAAAGAAMGSFAVLDDGHRLGALFELFATHPSVPAVMSISMLLSGIVGVVAWVVLAGGILEHLRGQTGAGPFVESALSNTPYFAAQALWFGILRALLIGGLTGSAMLLGPWALLIFAPLWLWTIPAFDLARARISRDVYTLEDGWRPKLRLLGPGPLARGIGGAIKRPAFLAASAGLGAAAMVISALMTYMAVAWMHLPGGIWFVRLLAVVPIVLGLSRLGLAVRQADAETSLD